MGNCTITLPGDTGTVVLEDNTVTLSNKTLSAPTITGLASFEGNVTLGNADTDVVTLTGRTTASAGLMIPDATVQDDALQIGSGGDFFIAHDGTDTAISNATGKLKITSTVNTVDAIRLRANGGSSETIFIRADQGTSVMTDGNSNASIQLKSDDGGIGIRSKPMVAPTKQLLLKQIKAQLMELQLPAPFNYCQMRVELDFLGQMAKISGLKAAAQLLPQTKMPQIASSFMQMLEHHKQLQL